MYGDSNSGGVRYTSALAGLLLSECSIKYNKVLDKKVWICYSKSMGKKSGKKFNKREVIAGDTDKQIQPNQWQASGRQLDWLDYYMNPKHKDTYGNPYQAALSAGYSESYARNIMNPSLALQWVQQAKTIMRSMNTEHLRQVLEDITVSKHEKTSDRIAAVKLLGIDQGMFVQKQMVAHVGLEQALEDLQ